MHRTAAILSALLGSLLASVHADEPNGEAIYGRLCAQCHGANGEGVADEFDEPLAGDRTLADLTRVITKTMPEGEPEKCTGDDATAVAKFVYDRFYSREARARNRPPRVALSRLTNRQYETAVADLLGEFLGQPSPNDERGLRAEYYADRKPRRDKRRIERVDATVDFDFGEGTPGEKGFDPEQFAIAWEGSLIPPTTGDYEFVVATENGARLFLNDTETPLIDAWVKSGSDTEYRGTLRLLGGRAVPLKLEFFTFKEKTASIRLKWRRPDGLVEVVPERALRTSRAPKTYVVDTPFPPDDRSEGYERGITISREWDDATTRAALDVGRFVAVRLDSLARTKSDAGDRTERVRDLARRFVARAFRRPLDDAERTFYVDRWFDDRSPETAIKRIVLLALKSPRFLFPATADGKFDDHAVAERLAFGLWDSLPDQPLSTAAEQGQLGKRGQVEAQANRMSRDPRATAKLRAFLEHWLGLDHLGELAKDEAAFPGFDERVADDLRTSLELSIDDLLESERADFRELLRGESLYLNGRLAKLYGADLPEEAGFRKVTIDGRPAAGLLSHPYLLSGLAYDDTTSPIHRGVFLARSVLGRRLRPPPDAFTPLAPDLHPKLNTRERVELQTSPESCRTCHAMINPLGFPLERFDAIGRVRTEEQGRPIDARGSYEQRTGGTATFDGPHELARFLADSDEVHEAFAEQLFQYTTKQPIQAYGPTRLDELRQRFVAVEFDIRRLFAECAVLAIEAERERTGGTAP